ncbi:MAG: Hint domain-containing protein [Paracoccaceae bacterium]
MPTQTVTVSLSGGDDDDTIEIKGKDLTDTGGASVVENHTQIVTILDGGQIGEDDDDDERPTFEFAFFGKSATDADQFLLDLSGFDDDFDIAVKSQKSDDVWRISGFDSYVRVGNVWTFTYTGTDGELHEVSIDAESTNGTGIATVVVCFVRGARILTPNGEVAVELLKQGDQVVCGDGTARDICWVGSRKLDSDALRENPKLKPVNFQPNALGDGQPNREMQLSPQHRVLLRDWRAELLFGESEVLAPAHALMNDTTITRDHSCDPVEYFHILLDGHHTVFADGMECETLMPAELAVSALDGAAREEIFVLFPELAANLSDYGPLYRRGLKNYETAVLRED